MRDNRGSRGAIAAFGRDVVTLPERILDLAVDAARTVPDIAEMLAYRMNLYRSRQQLRELTDAQLGDIGLTRTQADAEAARPFFEH